LQSFSFLDYDIALHLHEKQGPAVLGFKNTVVQNFKHVYSSKIYRRLETISGARPQICKVNKKITIHMLRKWHNHT
jgi:hypothetical protein